MDLTPPAGLDLTESKRPELYGAYSVTYALALLAFGLRIVSRTLISKAGLWWDDYLVCMAMVCFPLALSLPFAYHVSCFSPPPIPTEQDASH